MSNDLRIYLASQIAIMTGKAEGRCQLVDQLYHRDSSGLQFVVEQATKLNVDHSETIL